MHYSCAFASHHSKSFNTRRQFTIYSFLASFKTTEVQKPLPMLIDINIVNTFGLSKVNKLVVNYCILSLHDLNYCYIWLFFA